MIINKNKTRLELVFVVSDLKPSHVIFSDCMRLFCFFYVKDFNTYVIKLMSVSAKSAELKTL